MKNKSYYIWLIGFMALFFASCEKDVDLKLKGGADKLVVNASIKRTTDVSTGQELGEPPVVVLTKSINYFGNIDSSTLSDYFLHDLNVKISDGNRTIDLIEYRLTSPIPNVPFVSFYSIDTTGGLQNVMLGEYGKTYTLTVEWNGKTYTSSTQLIAPVPLSDSFWVENAPSQYTSKDTTFLELRTLFYEPPQKGQNYLYTFTTYGNQGDQVSTWDDYFNDEVINDREIPLIFFSQEFGGTEDSSGITRYGYFYPGDSVVIDWGQIDYNAFQFLNTKEFSSNSIGNPFATPVNVLGNVDNGGLGAFIATGSYIYHIIVQ